MAGDKSEEFVSVHRDELRELLASATNAADMLQEWAWQRLRDALRANADDPLRAADTYGAMAVHTRVYAAMRTMRQALLPPAEKG